MSNTKEYRTWWNMIARCEYPCSSSYLEYGAIGISVCSRWRKDFKAFYVDMGDAPTQNYTLDRIDGSKGYCKDNCRWATPSQQAMNRALSKTSKIKYKGVTFEKKKKLYRARITLNGKTMSLGRRKKAVDAANLYDVAAMVLFKEYAVTNKKLGLL